MSAALICIVGGIFVYSTLEYVLIPKMITIPLAILISILIFGLTRFYSQPFTREDNQLSDSINEDFQDKQTSDGKTKSVSQQISLSSASIFLFIVIYIISLVSSIFSNPDFGIFKSWDQVSQFSIVQLGFSIVLAFFLPGYALLLVMPCAKRLQPLLKVILAYLLSMLITGLTTFLSAITFSTPASEIKELLVVVYFVILCVLLISFFDHNKDKIKLNFILRHIFHKRNYPDISAYKGPLLAIKTRKYEILVFASLFALLIISTYYTYGGITLGDQWFHQGRSILFMSGSWKETALSDLDYYNSPFQSALIAGLTSLSGMPIVNTYASFAFLNIIPIFCFYYFLSKWIPHNMQRSKLVACSLFATFAGFGWIYLIGLVGMTGSITSELSAIDTIYSIRSYILMPSNFVIASHPDFNTGLIYIALPAGLTLLGLARQTIDNKVTYLILVTIVSTLGLLSHEEFHLFIIITCIIPLLFRLKLGYYLYFALLISLCITYAINLISIQNYYNSTEVLGFPLLSLNILFVAVTWSFYFLISYMRRIPIRHFGFLSTVPKSIKNLIEPDTRIKGIVPVVIVTVIAIVYLSSFVIIAPLSIKDVNDEALRGDVPWYQYPMKLGLAGLLGLAFIISYIFRKYEKEVFVFGIIIVVALLTTPYYDQHRFSKYVMLGMIAFASLLIYKILMIRPKPRPIVNGIIVMVVITAGSLSTLLFVGYNSLAFQNDDYTHDLGRRNFPSDSEMHLIKAIKNGVEFDSNRYNVVSTPDEYNFYKGTILTKLSTFAGFPIDKLLQGRFVLNVTNLDSLYRLLDYTNTKFIVIPKDSIKQQETKLSEPVRFVLNAFPHYYENEEYVVLEVPSLSPPSPGSEVSDVGLIYNGKDNLISTMHFNKTLLEYNNRTFNPNGLKQVKNLDDALEGNQNQAQNSVVCSPKRNEGLTVWSNRLDDRVGSRINYVETHLRIKDSHESDEWSDTGIRWKEGNKEYYESLSNNGLELYQKSVGNFSKGEIDKRLLYQNSEVEKKENVWYNLKLESLQNSVKVYVDDTLKAKFPRAASDNSSAGISNVAISCFNSDVEFTPIKVGTVESSHNESAYDIKNNYNHYFPLSILALPKSQYDTFMDSDLSALSKKTILLSFDPIDWDDTRFDNYLQYVNQGGTLVVINSDSTYEGRFSKLFSVQENANGSKFNFSNVMGADNEVIGIFGTVKNISINQPANISIIASYVNGSGDYTNNKVAPFALEKHYPNGGKIILVNAAGYFDAISESPGRYYTTLSNISSILGLHLPKAATTSITNLPIEQFVGNMDISGNVTLRSNSILELDSHNETNENDYGSAQNYNINTQHIKIYEDKKLRSNFSNVSIKDLKLTGNYNVTINSKDGLRLPYMTSKYNYVGVSIPSKFNMTINLSKKPVSSAEMVIQNQKNPSSSDTIKLNGGSTIEFNNIQGVLPINGPDSNSMQTLIPILLKSPEIKVDGKAKFSTLRFLLHYLENVPVEVQGLKARLNFIDDYNEPLGNGTKIRYITFMNSTTKF